MDEYIKKDEVIKLIREDKVEITPNLLTIAMLAVPNGYSVEDCYKAINSTCDRHIEDIRNLPAADVRPVMRGRWLHKETTDHFHVVGQCSVCKERKRIDNFCPHCGADMRGET